MGPHPGGDRSPRFGDTCRVLESLDAVDWSRRQHAFGPADDVPSLLRSVAAGGTVADEAINRLYETIWHQGTVYDATALAVPFLAELARADSVEVRWRELVLMMILDIGRGEGYWHVHADAIARIGHVPKDLDSRLQAEDRWVRACREAVGEAAASLLAELSAFPDRLWTAVAALVVVAGKPGATIVAQIAAEARHRGPRFRALGFSAIADLSTSGRMSAERLQELLSLDTELAHFAANEQDQGELDISLDSTFVDLLVERMISTGGSGRADSTV